MANPQVIREPPRQRASLPFFAPSGVRFREVLPAPAGGPLLLDCCQVAPGGLEKSIRAVLPGQRLALDNLPKAALDGIHQPSVSSPEIESASVTATPPATSFWKVWARPAKSFG